jgi:hypothetical protein
MSIAISTLMTRLQASIGDFENAYADKYLYAINDAARETYPTLHRKVDDASLITGNILPNSSFELWTSSSYPDRYNKISATCAETTSAGLVRSEGSAALVSPSAADGYMFITSGNTSEAGYPRLLNLMDKKISFKCWAKPSTVNDAFIEIYTLKYTSTGTVAQTLTSTATTNITAGWQLLELEDQTINDDIIEIQFRFKVHTNGQTCYFDDARVMGSAVYEYLLPEGFQLGELKQVWIQTKGQSDDICDDIRPYFGEEVFGWKVIDDGTYKYLKMPYLSSGKRLRLLGYAPLESNATATTATITLDDRYIPLFIAYAAYSLYEKQTGVVSSDSRDRYQQEAMKWLGKYEMLKSRLRMPRIPGQIRWSLDG